MPKAPADLRSLARSQTEMCVRVLTGIARSPKSGAPARVAAASSLLDRGWGKPAQPHVGDDELPIAVTIRKIISES
jgi:hypothetical protein